MKIDVGEQFDLLPKAPIVEAVIGIHARPGVSWEEKDILGQLKSKVSGFETSISRNAINHIFKLGVAQPPQPTEQNFGWHGLFCQSKSCSVQFNRDGFVYSCLQPYSGWGTFLDEALKLWKIYLEVARPTEMQRIGLRFINRISLQPKEADFEKYIQPYPEPPFDLDLPFSGFFHQDTLIVPGHSYAINIIRTIQPPQNPQFEGLGLIIDIDAYTTQALEIKEGILENRLAELRWLKNKAFFGSITPASLKLFQ